MVSMTIRETRVQRSAERFILMTSIIPRSSSWLEVVYRSRVFACRKRCFRFTSCSLLRSLLLRPGYTLLW